MVDLTAAENIQTRRQPVTPHYLTLGATLFMPATRHDLAAVANGEKSAGLRSVVVCTEDAILNYELPLALANLERLVAQGAGRQLLFFVRPRNVQVLDRILRMPGIDNIDGLVLPKVTAKNLPAFAEVAARIPHLPVMPTIETEVAFERRQLSILRNALEQLVNPVLCLRVGGNDLLSLLGLKRPKTMTLYDTPLRQVINDIILTFRPVGYEIASSVFEHLDSPNTLKREVEMDVVHGLLAKTAIHPNQITVIEETYRVSAQEREMAEKILDPNAHAVFQYGGQMCEPATHRPWAQRLLLRAELFGMC